MNFSKFSLPKLKKPTWSGVKQSFRSRAFRAGGYSMAAAAVVIAIAVAVNLLAGALPVAWTKVDLTDSGLYSLSAQTQQLVSALEEDVTIYWLVREGSEDASAEQLLERYEDLSDCLSVVKKDPVADPTFTQQYTSETLYYNSLIVVCGERSRYISYYDIYVTDYSSYYYTGSYTTEFDGESALTSAINYVSSADLPVVYTLTGHGEDDLPAELQAAAEEDNLLLEELSLLSQDAVPEDADAVLLYSPASDLSAQEAELLLDYLKAGGKLLLVTDYVDAAMPNLMEVMAYYGVSLMDGIVMEGDSNHYAWGSVYDLLPDINSHTVTSPLMGGGYYALLPVAQGIQVDEELRDGLTVTSLLTTSDSAYSKVAGYALTTYDKEADDIDGPFTLAVAITEETEDGGETGILWLTTSLMFDASYDQMVSGANSDLFLNALGWMCEREETVSIRAKSLSTEYLTVSAADASLWSVVLVGALPLAFLIWGAWVSITRRRR